MLNSAIELLKLTHDVNYEPTFVSTDRRRPNLPTSLGYYQIGELQQYGYAKGPIFKIEFVTLPGSGPTHVQLFGIENIDADAPIYPISYLNNLTDRTLEVYLKKFVFCNSSGTKQTVAANQYLVVGHKKKVMPFNW